MRLAPVILPITKLVFLFCSCYCAEGGDEQGKNDREEHKEKGGHEDRKWFSFPRK
jgi:hypothetical protein